MTKNKHIKKTRVKFCGITNNEDAQQASLLGADAIGFVFFSDSPVAIELTAAASIAQQLPPFISTVALCVNHNKKAVNAIINTVKPHILQFHGDESPSFCEQFNYPYIKAIRVQQKSDITQAIAQYPTAQALLLDSYQKGQYGGTGTTFNWSIIPPSLAKPIIIAGGLDNSNVYQAIEKAQPWGVDVSSKIATTTDKRKKNKGKMLAFLKEVKRADKY